MFSLKQKEYIFQMLKTSMSLEATYYRIHLDKVFENIDLGSVIYLDSDIICVNDPIPYAEKFSQI